MSLLLLFKAGSGTDVSISLDVLSITSSNPEETLLTDSVIAVGVQSLTTTNPEETISTGATLSVSEQLIVSSNPEESLSTDSVITLSSQDIVVSNPEETVSTLSPDATISVDTLLVSITNPEESILAEQNVTIEALYQILASSKPLAAISADSVISVSENTVTLSNPEESVVTEANATVDVISISATNPSTSTTTTRNVGINVDAILLGLENPDIGIAVERIIVSQEASITNPSVSVSTTRNVLYVVDALDLASSQPTATYTAVKNATVSLNALSIALTDPEEMVYAFGNNPNIPQASIDLTISAPSPIIYADGVRYFFGINYLSELPTNATHHMIVAHTSGGLITSDWTTALFKDGEYVRNINVSVREILPGIYDFSFVNDGTHNSQWALVVYPTIETSKKYSLGWLVKKPIAEQALANIRGRLPEVENTARIAVRQ